MDLAPIFQAIDASAISQTIRQSTWIFPTIETVHVVSLVLVAGTIALVDFRLLGWASRGQSAADVIERVLPATWAAFGVAVLSGGLLFSSNAVTYAGNVPFRIKMVLLFLAGVNMAVFHIGAHRRIAEWGHRGKPPLNARIAGALSLVLWTAIIFAGRWIGFLLSVF